MRPWRSSHVPSNMQFISSSSPKSSRCLWEGPCEDKSDLLSVVVLEAASETEAFGSLQDNPDVPQGVVKIEVHPWQVVCGPPSAER